MRQVPPYALWLGHVGDARNLRGVVDAGVTALVDLALEEPPGIALREMTYCRFPLLDGAGNAPWLLRTAIQTTALLIRAGTPTLVFCGAGMSRSPAVVAAALALVTGRPSGEWLEELAQAGACDLSLGLWQEITSAIGNAKE